MPHFKVSLDPVSISITSAALGPDVWPSLKMARAALEAKVEDAILADRADVLKQIDALKLARDQRIYVIREARKAALKVREADLPSEPAPAADTTVRVA